MLGLPKSTEYNKPIPSEKLLMNTKATQYMRGVFDEQIESVIWTNKVSFETCGIIPGKRFAEMEVLQINLLKNALDKRALSYIDNAIPYYVLYMQQYNSSYQVWLGDKTYVRNGKVKVQNYYRTRWISMDDFLFPTQEKTIDDAYRSCIERIGKLSYARSQLQQEATAEALIAYCQNMIMTYSYKPLLILALIQNGGCISVSNMARFYQRFFLGRKQKGLTVEKGNCIFADESARFSAMERNVIVNPINALMNSGLFEYDEANRLFYIKSEIYDSLTLVLVDKLEKICKARLNDYFKNIT